ncbi:protein translocase subunit SecF [Brachybacterium sp. p3-SID1565]|uniref:Protein-export membrane protein SecF n=1 Tax=Brachybacterium epidermidis TaxID=2781983 RepID=A0ABR9W590_9MICO|nr:MULTISPECIES: protein translocase subunit SecF [Brachybacterium]MBE9404458.1 protein translocase subunit SecF [Brachybacterium epidermidis]MCT1386045.1 protein translocase subunit SecF [Brachybacterium sp. p3-SID1565]
MTTALSSFGNSLHDGTRSFPFVRRRRTWYLLSAVVLLVLGTIGALRGPALGIEFTGGSEFQIAGVGDADQAVARDIVREHVPTNEPKISVLGQDTLRVQTEQLDPAETSTLAQELAEGYGVETSNVSTSFVGPVWSGDITQKMLRSVAVFLALVALTMALYFRNLKASIAAMLALLHDMALTIAVYLVVGFEITPATVIGFLTILGYSLYDTIVVFDKVRENTEDLTSQHRFTFAEQVERAANQTLVRSINTSVVALLPVGAILAIGAFVLGAGTLKDISLALFVGMLAGTYSSILLAPGLLVDLRRREPEIVAHTRRVRGGYDAEDPGAEDPAHVEADTGERDVEQAADRDPDDVDTEVAERTDAAPTEDRSDDAPHSTAADRTRYQPRRTSRRRRNAPRRGQP